MPFPLKTEALFHGRMQERIDRHNQFIINADCVRGYALACAGSRTAQYLSVDRSGRSSWLLDELVAHVVPRTRAEALLIVQERGPLWRYVRIVVVGATGHLVFDFPTIRGL